MVEGLDIVLFARQEEAWVIIGLINCLTQLSGG